MSLAEITVLFKGTEQRYQIQPDLPYGIGRSRHNAIYVESEAVSRNHALIKRSETGSFCLFDLASRNGTLLNQRLLGAPAQLRDGDVIMIGDATIRFSQKVLEAAQLEQPLASQSTVVVTDMVDVTVLVIDIRGYTSLAQNIGATLTAEVIAAFNRESGAILDAFGVWTVKFIGDAVMALWLNKSRPASETVVAAMRVFSGIHQMVQRLQSRFGLADPIGVGAGINFGPACVGNVGGGSVADYTALGDTVNMTFRLEASTRTLDCDVILGDMVYGLLKRVSDIRAFVKKRNIRMKGYSESYDVYCLTVADLTRLIGTLDGTATIQLRTSPEE
jgi:adenylate cyclase